ncbi:MAG: hypothetical protein Q9187_006886 [Circinaria calcarea]
MSRYISGIEPTYPDFHLCNPYYGHNLDTIDCGLAELRLPQGATPREYRVRGDSAAINPWVFPSQVVFGTCTVTVELADAEDSSDTVWISPDFIRGMANWVLEQCVRKPGRLGGFVTGNLANYRDLLLAQYLVNPTSWHHAPVSPAYAFITVTVSGPWEKIRSPGEYDPAVPHQLARAVQQAAMTEPERSSVRSKYQNLAKSLTLAALDTPRSSNHRWTRNPPGLDTMTYECDSKLGVPRPIDCIQIAYSQLGFPSDTISIRPGIDKLLSLSK